jgi:hypothetical protein
MVLIRKRIQQKLLYTIARLNIQRHVREPIMSAKNVIASNKGSEAKNRYCQNGHKTQWGAKVAEKDVVHKAMTGREATAATMTTESK